jgi:hypothetical protein
LAADVQQFAFEPAIFLFQLLRRTLAWAGGRQGCQLLFPLLKALVADPSSAAICRTDLLPESQSSTAWRLNCSSDRLCVRAIWFSVFMGFVSSSHNHPTLVHQIEATPVLSGRPEGWQKVLNIAPNPPPWFEPAHASTIVKAAYDHAMLSTYGKQWYWENCPGDLNRLGQWIMSDAGRPWREWQIRMARGSSR